MKIIDTTTYFEEDLMMDLRFNVLDKYVDEFIVCEATFSHSGKEKNINFNKKNFPKFEKKINHIIVDKEPNDIINNKELSSAEQRLFHETYRAPSCRGDNCRGVPVYPRQTGTKIIHLMFIFQSPILGAKNFGLYFLAGPLYFIFSC